MLKYDRFSLITSHITVFTRVQVDLVYKSTPDFGSSKQGTNFNLKFGNHDTQVIPLDCFPDVSSQ